MNYKFFFWLSLPLFCGWLYASAQSETGGPELAPTESAAGVDPASWEDGIKILDWYATQVYSLEQEVVRLENEIKSLQDRISKVSAPANPSEDSITRARAKACLDDAFFILRLPYSDQNIEVAIATFEDTRGTKIYEERQDILDLLKNYKTDSKKVNDLESNWETLTIEEFESVPVVKTYSKYPGTYLGRKIENIRKMLRGKQGGSPDVKR